MSNEYLTAAQLQLYKDIVAKGRQVRELQRAYFKGRDPNVMRQAQVAEREFDELLRQEKEGVACKTEDMFGA